MSCSYNCFSAGTYSTEKERGEGMLHSYFDYALGKERVVQMRAEVERSRLEAPGQGDALGGDRLWRGYRPAQGHGYSRRTLRHRAVQAASCSGVETG